MLNNVGSYVRVKSTAVTPVPLLMRIGNPEAGLPADPAVPLSATLSGWLAPRAKLGMLRTTALDDATVNVVV